VAAEEALMWSLSWQKAVELPAHLQALLQEGNEDLVI
jgi:hypothetical protein